MLLLVLLIIDHLTSLRSLLTTAVATSGIGAALMVAQYYFSPKKRKYCFMYIVYVFHGAFYGWGAGFLIFFGVAGLYFPIHILRNSALTVN
mmetsp:Transcript_11981/g.16594  ORF Transcript_11981/g.16594 Transcript_11981/m.16594 type:complete len:91 (-) Transcript_11981:393-665(-)